MVVLLASTNRCAENIPIEPIVVSELKLSDVQRHIFCADLMERANNATLEDRPEAFNRIGVNCADNVLPSMMVNGRVRESAWQFLVTGPRISRQQTYFVGNHFIDEIVNRLTCHVLQHAGDNITLALYSTNDRRFYVAIALLFIPVAVSIFAADKCFVHFNNAAKFFHRLHQRRADFVAHAVCGAIGAEAHLPLNLKGADAFLAGQHQMDNFEPFPERLVGVLKNRARDHRKPIARKASRSALRALPVPLAGRQVIHGGIATTRAVNAVGPAAGLQISLGRIIVPDWETRLKLAFRHLMHRFGMFCHCAYPSTSTVGGYCHG